MANVPISNMTVTWTDSGTTYNAVKMNVTDTASNAASLLMDLQVGGTSRFNVRKDGRIGTTASSVDTAGGYYGFTSANLFTAQIASANAIGGISTGVHAVSFGFLTSMGSIPDLILFRDAANTLAQRNATNAQAFRVYNTFTDASNYERGKIEWSANNLEIGVEAAGTGTKRPVGINGANINFRPLSAATTAVWQMAGATGHFLAVTDNTYDIGASGASRPRSIYAGTDIYAQSNTAGFYLGASSDVALLRDNANTLAMRRSTNPQTFNIYNTYTDASNYERGIFSWSTNQFQIGTESAGTGSARDLYLVSGSGNIRIGRSGGNANLIFFNDNAADIGASGANRPRNVYVANQIFGNQVVVSAVFPTLSSRSYITSPSDGQIAFWNNSGTDFGRLQFGGTTSAFPALKRVGANLQTVAADDTATAGLIVGNQALATTATDGFLYVPTCAGTPTGVPTARTGTVPIVVDTTNNKLYFYSGAAWRDAGP